MARARDLWKDPERRGRGKRWLAVWAGPDGRERTRAFEKKTDAERYAAAQETDALRGVGIDPRSARITVGSWIDEAWLPGYERHRPSTVRQARVQAKRIKAVFGGMTLASVRPSHVKSWVSSLVAEGLQPSYVYALHARLAHILSDAVDDGLIPRSPCSKKTAPRQAGQRPYVATTAEVWALYDAMPARLRASVLLGAFAGLRVAEACGLRPGDVDFMRAVIHPAAQFPAEPLKTETSRTAIPIAQSLALELAAHVRQWPGETILTSEDGAQVGPWLVERAIRAARAGVPGMPAGFRFHDLRHYLASLLIASGADVKVVQQRLRHKSARTTLDCYGHLWPDRDESTRAAVEAIFQDHQEQGRNRAGSR